MTIVRTTLNCDLTCTRIQNKFENFSFKTNHGQFSLKVALKYEANATYQNQIDTGDLHPA